MEHAKCAIVTLSIQTICNAQKQVFFLVSRQVPVDAIFLNTSCLLHNNVERALLLAQMNKCLEYHCF